MSLRLRDEHGTFHLDSGSPVPIEESDKEFNYDVCGAALKYSEKRYGETRYCTAMAMSNFTEEEDDNYSKYCKNHKGYENTDMLHQDNFVHGAYVKSYQDLAKYMPLHKYVVAVEIFKTLRDRSAYDFSGTVEEIIRDASDADWIAEDEVTIELPIADDNRDKEKALFMASLDFSRMEMMEEAIFKDAYENSLEVGETLKVIDYDPEKGEVKTEAEHHLNLPLSRIVNDYQKHMEVGGINLDVEEQNSGGTEGREWFLEINTSDGTDVKAGTSSDGAEDDTEEVDYAEEPPTF